MKILSLQKPKIQKKATTEILSYRFLRRQGAFPVSDALVTITSQESGLVSVLVTGKDGRTPAIRLPAPPLSESFNPADKAPFSLYNIDTDAAALRR